MALALIVFAVLTVIAAAHAAWAFGALAPARSEAELVGLVVGKTGGSIMPSRGPCLAAASVILAAGLLALLEVLPTASPPLSILLGLAGLGATAVFLGRGLAAYLPAWRRRFALEPFATLDRRFYGPLCLCLAAAFFFLSLNQLGAFP